MAGDGGSGSDSELEFAGVAGDGGGFVDGYCGECGWDDTDCCCDLAGFPDATDGRTIDMMRQMRRVAADERYLTEMGRRTKSRTPSENCLALQSWRTKRVSEFERLRVCRARPYQRLIVLSLSTGCQVLANLNVSLSLRPTVCWRAGVLSNSLIQTERALKTPVAHLVRATCYGHHTTVWVVPHCAVPRRASPTLTPPLPAGSGIGRMMQTGHGSFGIQTS